MEIEELQDHIQQLQKNNSHSIHESKMNYFAESIAMTQNFDKYDAASAHDNRSADRRIFNYKDLYINESIVQGIANKKLKDTQTILKANDVSEIGNLDPVVLSNKEELKKSESVTSDQDFEDYFYNYDGDDKNSSSSSDFELIEEHTEIQTEYKDKDQILKSRQMFKLNLEQKAKQRIMQIRKEAQFNQQRQFVKDVTQQFENKEKMYLSHDLIGFTVLCLLKQNRRKYQLSMEKQSQIVFTALVVMVVQSCLIYALGFQIVSEVHNFIPKDDQTFQLFLAKFMTTTALHINIYPEFASGMQIMKYVNNHPFNFDRPRLAFVLGFIQMVFAFIFEFCNIIILFSRATVFQTIASFVTLDVLFRLQTMYL